MDFLASLKAEIEAKKKQVAEVAGDKTYIKVGELEAKRQKEYEEEQRRLEEKRQVRGPAHRPAKARNAANTTPLPAARLHGSLRARPRSGNRYGGQRRPACRTGPSR